MSSVDTRNLSRDSLFMFGDIVFDGSREALRIKIRNLSDGGMMAEGGIAAMTGQQLTIRLKAVGEVRGTVAWVQGNRFGVAFANPIEAEKVRTPLFSREESEAPRYARPALSSRQLLDRELQLRRI